MVLQVLDQSREFQCYGPRPQRKVVPSEPLSLAGYCGTAVFLGKLITPLSQWSQCVSKTVFWMKVDYHNLSSNKKEWEAYGVSVGRNSGPRGLAYLLSGLRLFMGNFMRWLD